MSARKQYSYYRHIRTTQERRIGCDEEHEKYSRPNRHSNNLPEAYDDIIIRNDKSWKSERKSQFRDVEYKKYVISFYPETPIETRQIYKNVRDILSSMKYRVYSDTVKIHGYDKFGGEISYIGKDIGKIKGCVIKCLFET